MNFQLKQNPLHGSDIFLADLDCFLCPELQPRRVAVMDNLALHEHLVSEVRTQNTLSSCATISAYCAPIAVEGPAVQASMDATNFEDTTRTDKNLEELDSCTLPRNLDKPFGFSCK